MKLIEDNTPNKHELNNRLISEDGKIEMGIYRVAFGYRIRAGFTDNNYCEIDWCCGDESIHINFLYTLVKEYLKAYEENDNPFKELPVCSKIKPYYKDDEFMNMLRDKVIGYIKNGNV